MCYQLKTGVPETLFYCVNYVTVKSYFELFSVAITNIVKMINYILEFLFIFVKICIYLTIIYTAS